MAKSPEAVARGQRQERVSKAVWGLLFVTMGALFYLDDLGRIDLGPPSANPARLAVDGDPETRWSSAFADPQWIAVDLGEPAEITRVTLNWESAYATDYRIEVSDDGSSWTTALHAEGKRGVDEHELKAHGRYVRVYGTARATPYGYSLWEFEVYGVARDAKEPSPALLSRDKAVSASSTERNRWLLGSIYWPVFLIASGLPLLLAPKDGGEQVFGLILAGGGLLLQLTKLGVVSWSFGQAWPILLLVAGLLLVTQSLAQRSRRDGDGPATGGGATGGGAP